MNIFLSKYINKVDKKGRVSIPASYRLALSKEKIGAIIVYPSFRNDCIEACGISRLEEIYNIIQNLDPYSEERDAFETIIMGESVQLPFDNEGRVLLPSHLTQKLDIQQQACFVGKGNVFEIWNPEKFDLYLSKAKNIAQSNRSMLKNLKTNINNIEAGK